DLIVTGVQTCALPISISTISQVRSQPELASELHPSRRLHQDDSLFEVAHFVLQLQRPSRAFLQGPLGLMQQLDGFRQLQAPLFQIGRASCRERVYIWV